MNNSQAGQIVQNAVATTEPRWKQYAQSWKDIDTIFIRQGYEQQGFRFFRLVPFLSERGIFSIDALGSILNGRLVSASYDPQYAKGVDSEFYRQLRNGTFGENGLRFAEATLLLKEREPVSCGRFYWKLLWYVLQACSYLRQHHQSSFARYLISKYSRFSRKPALSESQFLSITETDWHTFLSAAKPWEPLKGIGENVFDFLIGDIVEAQFARDSYKFDSANEYFLKATGVASIIVPLARGSVIEFMRQLRLPYTLREINKGIYTYCSLTEAENYGYCRNPIKCQKCTVFNICERNL